MKPAIQRPIFQFVKENCKATKHKPTIKQEAGYLIEAAEDVANRYILEHDGSAVTIASREDVRRGMEYAYILAGLRMHSVTANDVRDVVGKAMKIKFKMSDEEFATSILGG